MTRSTLQPPIATEDIPGQLPLFPEPALSADGRSFSFGLTVEFPGRVDDDLVQRLAHASRRLRRGGVVSNYKLRKLAKQVEQLATLFDGAP